MNSEGEICPWCGEPYLLDLLEVWPDERAWMFETCCEEAHEEVLYELQVDPKNAGEILRALFERHGVGFRSIYQDLDWMRLDFGLQLCPVIFAEACAFVDRHHRHNAPPRGWRWGHGVKNGEELVAVAMVGRPVAPAHDASKIVEVNRLCIDPTVAPSLVRHAASMLYGAAAREAKRRGFERIITYTLETEPGTSLVAAGWTPESRTRGGSWHRTARPREDRAPTCPKIRWARQFRRAI